MKTIACSLALLGFLAGGCTTSADNTKPEEPAKEEPAPREDNQEKQGNDMTHPFNFETRTVQLNSGWEMPIIGIGTYYLSTSQAEEIARIDALERNQRFASY